MTNLDLHYMQIRPRLCAIMQNDYGNSQNIWILDSEKKLIERERRRTIEIHNLRGTTLLYSILIFFKVMIGAYFHSP